MPEYHVYYYTKSGSIDAGWTRNLNAADVESARKKCETILRTKTKSNGDIEYVIYRAPVFAGTVFQKKTKPDKEHFRNIRDLFQEVFDFYDDVIADMKEDFCDLIDMTQEDYDYARSCWEAFERQKDYNDLEKNLLDQDTSPRGHVYKIIDYLREENLI